MLEVEWFLEENKSLSNKYIDINNDSKVTAGASDYPKNNNFSSWR